MHFDISFTYDPIKRIVDPLYARMCLLVVFFWLIYTGLHKRMLRELVPWYCQPPDSQTLTL